MDCNFIGSLNHVKLSKLKIATTEKAFIQNITLFDAETFGLDFYFVNNVTITKSIITNNIFGIQSIDSNFKISDTKIIGNALGVLIIVSQQLGMPDFKLESTIRNCAFFSNANGGLLLMNIHSLQITDSSFYSNQGTSITAYQSTFELQGETVFRNNIVRSGGALTLINSTVIFSPYSKTIFINNTAEEFGGAILNVNLLFTQLTEQLILVQTIKHNRPFLEDYIVDSDTIYKQSQKCFYSLQENSVVFFAGNKATLGGYDIFGASIMQECYFTDLKFNNETSNPYKISSDPMRVCFCTSDINVPEIPQCGNKKYLVLNETRCPGETFTVPVVLAGYNLGRVAGTVYTNVLDEDYKQTINRNQHVQSVNVLECSELTYTIFSSQTSDSVVLILTPREQYTQLQKNKAIGASVENIYSGSCLDATCTALLTTPVYINITLEACPLGFELSETTRVCECDTNLAAFRDNDQVEIICEIRNRTGYITREGTVWVGVDTNENNTDIYYWHRYCPRDHCNSSQTSIDLRSPDGQCSSNRAGVLCGKCEANYSLQLGGNKCIKCNNSHLALLIVFGVLGILLVALIKLLDLTVTSATINGLIFYANVVWRNNAILFSLQDRQSVGYYIITVPIAWINLDFGIETVTCLSENLDQLFKTGLQFLFPVYIWCIAGLIIITSHYSTRATRLFGNNSVPVLSTLFLLSYGKLFRNITDVFTFADVSDSNGTTHKVWSLDGNIRYGGTPGHMILIVFALLFLILFILPFTLALLLVPFLRAKSHLRPFRWINTLKPFFDTYYGPFKDKRQHQVWTGILLVSRVVILIVFASTSTSSPNANILLMTLVSILLLMYSGSVGLLYRKWHWSFLENLYILNLAMLGGTFLFYRPTDLDQVLVVQQHDVLNPVATTSVIMALVLFILTVIIYTAKRVISTEKLQRCLKRNQEDETELEDIAQLLPEAQNNRTKPTVQVVSIKKAHNDDYDPTLFRETLLEEM